MKNLKWTHIKKMSQLLSKNTYLRYKQIQKWEELSNITQNCLHSERVIHIHQIKTSNNFSQQRVAATTPQPNTQLLNRTIVAYKQWKTKRLSNV